jgi:hypothetical protein
MRYMYFIENLREKPLMKISTRQPSKQQNAFLKGHGNEINFSVFCIIRFGLGPFQNCFTHFDFGVKFVEIFVIENRLPVDDTASSVQ